MRGRHVPQEGNQRTPFTLQRPLFSAMLQPLRHVACCRATFLIITACRTVVATWVDVAVMLRACLALVIALVLTSFLPGGHGAPHGHPREEHQPLVQQAQQQLNYRTRSSSQL